MKTFFEITIKPKTKTSLSVDSALSMQIIAIIDANLFEYKRTNPRVNLRFGKIHWLTKE